MESVSFSVLGEPKGMGSSKAVPTRSNWRFVPGVRWKVVDASHNTDDWQKKVSAAAKTAMWAFDPMDGPLAVMMTFGLSRPMAHYGTGKNVRNVRPAAPQFPANQRDDLDKLVRAVGDALTGIVYDDDGQVINLHAWKRYGKPGVQITVSRIGPS
jgi:crossover junction endodeoxyribonuclease RusA